MQKCVGILRSGRLFLDEPVRVQLSKDFFLTIETMGYKHGSLGSCVWAFCTVLY